MLLSNAAVLPLVLAVACSVCATSHSSTDIPAVSSSRPSSSTPKRSITEELEDTFRRHDLGLVREVQTTTEPSTTTEDPDDDYSDDDKPTIATDMKPPKEDASQGKWNSSTFRPTTGKPAMAGFLVIRIIESVRSKDHPDQITVRDRGTLVPLTIGNGRTASSTVRPLPSTTRTRQTDSSISEKQSVFSESEHKQREDQGVLSQVSDEHEGAADDLEGSNQLYPGYYMPYAPRYPVYYRPSSYYGYGAYGPIRPHFKFW